MFEWLWNERWWFPENINVGWKDLENKPETGIYYPKLRDLHWSLALGVVFVVVRYLITRFVIIPLGYYLGVPRDPKQHVLASQPALEAAYRLKKTLIDKDAERLSKLTDMTERQVHAWFRKRQQNDSAKLIYRFSENCWHFLFYSTAFIGGLIILWHKPWFADREHNWIGWPRHHVSNSVYWYYTLECAFYWSLVFTLFSDHQRKDFKQMILHHVATLLLLYVSWLMNVVRAGTLILLLHDAADPLLALAKMMSYCKNRERSSTISFALLLIVWTITRLYLYPVVILYNTTVESYVIVQLEKTFLGYWLLNIFLYLLMVLHLMWSYDLARIAVNRLSAGKLKDVRSDSEDTDSEDDSSVLSKPKFICSRVAVLNGPSVSDSISFKPQSVAPN